VVFHTPHSPGNIRPRQYTRRCLCTRFEWRGYFDHATRDDERTKTRERRPFGFDLNWTNGSAECDGEISSGRRYVSRVRESLTNKTGVSCPIRLWVESARLAATRPVNVRSLVASSERPSVLYDGPRRRLRSIITIGRSIHNAVNVLFLGRSRALMRHNGSATNDTRPPTRCYGTTPGGRHRFPDIRPNAPVKPTACGKRRRYSTIGGAKPLKAGTTRNVTKYLARRRRVSPISYRQCYGSARRNAVTYVY